MGLLDLLNLPPLPVPGVHALLPRATPPVPIAPTPAPAPIMPSFMAGLSPTTAPPPLTPPVIKPPSDASYQMLLGLLRYHTQGNRGTGPRGTNAGASGAGRTDWGTGTTGPISSGTEGGWGGYSNGRIPISALAPIGQGFFMQPTAAAAWRRMSAAAQADGVTIGIGQSYRTYAQQVALAQEKGLYSQGGLAAVPGTSDHGWGLAVDVTSGEEWLAQHAAQYGFGTIPREPWHWQYGGALTPPPPPPPHHPTTHPTPHPHTPPPPRRGGRQ